MWRRSREAALEWPTVGRPAILRISVELLDAQPLDTLKSKDAFREWHCGCKSGVMLAAMTELDVDGPEETVELAALVVGV